MRDMLAPMLLVIGVVTLGFILMWSVRGKIARRNSARPTPREHIQQIKRKVSDREDSGVAEATAQRRLQQMAAQLDNRAERLQQLMDQADRKMAELEEFLEHTATGKQAYGGAATPAPAVSRSQTPTRTGRPDNAKPTPGRSVREVASNDQVDRAAPAQPRVSLDPLTEAVYELADKGQNPIDIARALEEQTGKIELILSLRGR